MAARKPSKKPAKKKTAPAKAKTPAKKANRKKITEESRGMGDNLVAIRKAAEPIFERFLSLTEAMESDMGGYQSDFGTLYEQGAAEIGCKESVLKKELKRMLRNKREAEAEAEMSSAERDQTEALRAAMEKTKYAQWTQGDLFPQNEEVREEEAQRAEERAAKAEAKKAEAAAAKDDTPERAPSETLQ